MSIQSDEVYNGLDEIDSLYYCGSACFLSLAGKIYSTDRESLLIRKLLDLSYLDAFLFSYSRISDENRDEIQKERISKSLHYYKDVIDGISDLLGKIDDESMRQSISLDLNFIENLQKGNESIFDPEDMDYPYDETPIVSISNSLYSSLLEDEHRLSLLCSLKMAYKLIYRKNMGKKPFLTFDVDKTLDSIRQTIVSLETESYDDISFLIDLIVENLVLAEPEVKNATLKEDFIYLGQSIKLEFDILINTIR